MKRQRLSMVLGLAGALWISPGLAQLSATAVDAEPRLVLRMAHWLNLLPLDRSGAQTAPAAEVQNWLPGSSLCQRADATDWQRLTLGESLARTLCASSTLRQALANVTEQTAGVTLAEVELRPRWNLSAGYSMDRNFNSSGSWGRTADATLGLSWVLFDFGQRNASLRDARATLAASLAQQNNSLIETVRTSLQQYGDAVIAAASLQATREAEATATRTAEAAQARYQAQVASQIDRLQAQTALEETRLERVRAEGLWENARAALALALNANPGQPMQLVDWESLVQTDQPMPELAVLVQEARQIHPRLQALRYQVDGAQARLDAAKAQYKGSVSANLAGGTSRNWGSAGAGSIPAGNAQLRLSLPLFNQRERQAAEMQALARKTQSETELETARREVESQLWQAYQALLTGRQSVSASERLLTSAQATYQVAQGRYQAGVGSVLDLLNAQTSLAQAQRQQVSARVELLNARLGLSLASGRLGR